MKLKTRALLWTLPAFLAGVLITGAPAQGQEQTRSATAFADSVCFNTHAHYDDTPYADQDALIMALNRVGPGLTIRDSATGRADEAELYRRAWSEGGHRLILASHPATGLTPEQSVRYAATFHGIRAVEGPNEYNTVEPFREYAPGSPRQWALDGAQWVRRLVAARDAIPGLDVPIIDLSTTTWQAAYEYRDAVEQTGGPQGVIGNVHLYAAGANIAPGHANRDSGWAEPFAWHRDNLAFVPQGQAVKWWVTETGYHTSLLDPGAAVPPLGGHHGVPERVQSAYLVDSFLESAWYQFFQTNDPVTCSYELVDGSCPNCAGVQNAPAAWHHQNNFGIYRSDYTPKPARNHIRNLLRALRVGGMRDTPVMFDYTLEGPGGQPGWWHYRYFSMRRGDGRKVVAVWRSDTLWDRESYQLLNVPPKPARLVLSGGVQDVDVINPAVSAQPLLMCRTRSGAVSWQAPADDVTLFIVGPRRARNPGACT
jgi:hypothetical protein